MLSRLSRELIRDRREGTGERAVVHISAISLLVLDSVLNAVVITSMSQASQPSLDC